MRKNLVALFSAVALLAGACSSTSRRASPDAVDPTTAGGTGAPVATSSLDTSETPGATPAGATGTHGVKQPGTGLGSPGGFTGKKGVYYGPALTGDIKVGFTVFDTAGVSALTGTNPNSDTSGNGDDIANRKAEIQALVAWANKTGGIGGRKVIGIPYTMTAADADQNQRVSHCTQAAEDDHVEAFIDNNGFFSETDFSCLAGHKVTYVGWAETMPRSYIERNAPYINTTYPAADRLMIALADGLNNAKYFRGVQNKVGVVIDDVPALVDAYNKIMIPRLKKYGVTPYATIRINPVDQSSQATQCSNAVLQFQGHVTNVIMLVNIIGFLSCSQQAASQNYSPRYGLGDYQLLAAGAPVFGQAGTLKNAVAVSSNPSNILESRRVRTRSATDDIAMNDPDTLPGRKRCVRIFTEMRHVDYSKGSSPRSTAWPTYCDHFLLWLDAARKIGNPLTSLNWGKGLAQVRTYQSTIIHDTDFGTGIHDGAYTYRVGIYADDQTSCSCYRLSDPTWFTIPR